MRSLALAAALLAAVPASAELRLELVRESLTGVHCRYREYVDGVPNDEYIVVEDRQSCLSSVPGQAGLPVLHRLRIRGRIARRAITEDHYAEDYDVETGALIRRVPLFFNAKAMARVFDPNPVAALNNPALRDDNDAAGAVPDSAYKLVELDNIAGSGPLRGPHIALVDRQTPTVAPPDSAASLIFNRSDDGFEDVNAYFHVDRTQRHLQALGYTGSRAIATYAVETDAHAAGGLDNSFFLVSSSKPGTGTLFFGTGGTDDAEDADLVVHEYGHALLEWIAPGTFTGALNSQARAFSEAFCDYLAFSAHHAQRVASGRDPYCFADWDTRCSSDAPSELCQYPPNTDCLRRLDSTRTMADYDTSESSGVEHRNSAIFSSALRELFLALGRDITDTLVIESTFAAPPLPSYAVMAHRILDADRLLYGSAHADTICGVLASRGILTAGTCSIEPRGEWTLFQGFQNGAAIPDANPSGITSLINVSDTRAIENVYVRVDIAHPSRGDLRIELTAPDGTRVTLMQPSLERAADVHATFGLDATPVQSLSVLRQHGAFGTWRLRVSDERTRDLGTLISWGLVFQFAGAAPLAERPRDRRVSRMIPVVAHRHGAYDTFFASDLRIANPGASRETATLIFTPSGADGLTGFSAVDVVLEPQQTIAFDDVLMSVFNRSGSGSLEILGNVLAMSRTYTMRSGGTVGQQVPPVRDTVAFAESRLFAQRYPDGIASRVNVGVTELAGKPGMVQISHNFFNGVTLPIEPFGHVQVSLPNQYEFTTIGVVAGESRVGAYMSQIDNASGDAMFIPAVKIVNERTRVAPVVDAAGLGGTAWRSQLWFQVILFEIAEGTFTFFDALRGDSVVQRFGATSQHRTPVYPQALPDQYGRSNTFGALVSDMSPTLFAASRIVSGNTTQFVPLLPIGPAEQQLLFIENDASYRTNVGIVSAEPAAAELIVLDRAGNEIQRTFLVADNRFAQTAVSVPVTHGRALVRFLAGRGRAYASLVDNRTGDATYVESQ